MFSAASDPAGQTREQAAQRQAADAQTIDLQGGGATRAGRVAREELEIRGTRIGKGDSVMLMFGSANRDSRHFREPDRLALDRKPNRHLGFGRGRHVCIGAPLARREAQIAFKTLLSRLPKIELAETQPTWRPSMAMRGLEALPVELSVCR